MGSSPATTATGVGPWNTDKMLHRGIGESCAEEGDRNCSHLVVFKGKLLHNFPGNVASALIAITMAGYQRSQSPLPMQSWSCPRALPKLNSAKIKPQSLPFAKNNRESIIEGKAVKIRRPLPKKDVHNDDKLETACPAKKKESCLPRSVTVKSHQMIYGWAIYLYKSTHKVSQTRLTKKATTLPRKQSETPVETSILWQDSRPSLIPSSVHSVSHFPRKFACASVSDQVTFHFSQPIISI